MKPICRIFLLSFFVQACVSDVNIELPQQNSIVLNGLIVPGNAISVQLWRSGTNTDTAFTAIEQARVTLFVNEAETALLHYRDSGIYQTTTVAGELTSYKIEVLVDEKEKAWAETFTPELNFGADIHGASETTSSYNGGNFSLSLVDHPDYKNDYWVCNLRTMVSYNSVTTKSMAYSLYSNSPFIDQFNVTYDPGGNGTSNFDYSYFMHLDDSGFNGSTVSIDFHCSGAYGVKEENIMVYNMDVHYSNYLKSKMINEEGGDNLTENGPPISYKPAFVYSNVHGGFGILGSYTSYTKTYQYK